MLISVRKGFVFLSMTKTASTSVETALGPYCDITVTYPLKHLPFQGFKKYFEPILRRKCGLARSDYEVVCLFREPISWLNSYYRYRYRERKAEKLRKRNKYTGDLSFSDFLEAYLQETPPPFAKLGDPARFVSNRKGKVGVDRIFKYEDIETFRAYATRKLRAEIEFPLLNVSPKADFDIPTELRDRVREKLADAYRIYDNL